MRHALPTPRGLAGRTAGRRGVRARTAPLSPGDAADAAYGWTPAAPPSPSTHVRRPRTPTGGVIVDLPVSAIRRPLGKSRSNDAAKVAALAASIAEHGLREPIDVLAVRVEKGEGEGGDGEGDGEDGASLLYYGFSGCHRYEAHQVLGRETIACRVRVVSAATLRMHLA